MENKKYEALRMARSYWQMEESDRGHGPEFILLLARTGIFTHMELAKLCNITPYASRTITQGMDLPRYKFGEKFDPRTIDSMILVMEHFDAWGTVPRGVMDLIIPYTSISVVSRMTGIGVTDLANPEPVFS